MPKKFDHTILIVDDEESIGLALGRIVKGLGVKCVYMPSGNDALAWMEKTSSPVSLILSDQRMPGMTGSVFLEKAGEISPNTLRFLITGYADMVTVSDAVNRGAIHRYIIKPWDNKALAEAMKEGLGQYERVMENFRLLALAKKQNAKLYALNTELKKRDEEYQEALLQKNKYIAGLAVRLERGSKERNHMDEIKNILKDRGMFEEEKLNVFYRAVAGKLFQEFQELASGKGFEMPQALLKE
jgi:response regulator RpfG family c-di-GMP phosphodiesterase